MSISTPTKIKIPFANVGAKNEIPDASQIGIIAGKASMTDGFVPLNMTPVAAGGVPPLGQDFNGILNKITEAIRFQQAGGSFVFDQDYATAIGGYPLGAFVLRSDRLGYWINTTAGNTTDPESGGANWVPGFTSGITALTMTNASVTLTAAQYGKPIIIILGALSANLNLIFPSIGAAWTVFNACTGAYSVTCKTAAGTGFPIPSGNTTEVVCDGANIMWGNNTAPTSPQFDNSADIASTAFVHNALGNYSGFANFSSDQTLTNDLLGKLLVPNTAGSMTINLNSKASSVPGSSFTIFNSGSGIVTVNPQSGDLLQAGYAAVASLLIEAGSYACITNVGGQWIAAGSATLKYEGLQKVLFTGSGYQRFPSGMLMQWGSVMSSTSGAATFTYPMAFPNAYICGSVSAIATVPVAPVFNQVPTQTYSQVDVYSLGSVRVATTAQIVLFGY